MAKYLDKQGLNKVWQATKDYVIDGVNASEKKLVDGIAADGTNQAKATGKPHVNGTNAVQFWTIQDSPAGTASVKDVVATLKQIALSGSADDVYLSAPITVNTTGGSGNKPDVNISIPVNTSVQSALSQITTQILSKVEQERWVQKGEIVVGKWTAATDTTPKSFTEGVKEGTARDQYEYALKLTLYVQNKGTDDKGNASVDNPSGLDVLYIDVNDLIALGSDQDEHQDGAANTTNTASTAQYYSFQFSNGIMTGATSNKRIIDKVVEDNVPSGATAKTASSSFFVSNITSGNDNTLHFTRSSLTTAIDIKNIIGTAATATANGAAENPYLNLILNNAVKSSNRIVGSQGIHINSNANGQITFTQNDVNIHVDATKTVAAGANPTVATAVAGQGTFKLASNGAHPVAGDITIAGTAAYSTAADTKVKPDAKSKGAIFVKVSGDKFTIDTNATADSALDLSSVTDSATFEAWLNDGTQIAGENL